MRVFVIAIALLLVACGEAPTPSPRAAESVVAFDEQGLYRLELELPKATYAAGETIEGIARLRFAGPGATDIAGSGSGLIVTSLVDADGTVLTGGQTLDCSPYTIDPANPLSTGLVKSGGYSPDDPADDFIEAFLKDPVFRLPAGNWAIQASSDFQGKDCAPPRIQLATSIQIVVTD